MPLSCPDSDPDSLSDEGTSGRSELPGAGSPEVVPEGSTAGVPEVPGSSPEVTGAGSLPVVPEESGVVSFLYSSYTASAIAA